MIISQSDGVTPFSFLRTPCSLLFQVHLTNTIATQTRVTVRNEIRGLFKWSFGFNVVYQQFRAMYDIGCQICCNWSRL